METKRLDRLGVPFLVVPGGSLRVYGFSFHSWLRFISMAGSAGLMGCVVVVLLGILGLVRAVPVRYKEYFDSKEPMGTKLSNSLVVLGFATPRRGQILVAEAKGTIRMGDKIVSVNGEAVHTLRLNAFLKVLKEATLPRTIEFEGERLHKEIDASHGFLKLTKPENAGHHHGGAGTAEADPKDDLYERVVPSFRITFPGNDLAGIQFAGDANSTVVGFSRSARNALRAAEKNGGIRIGDVLLAVNNQEVDRLNLHELIQSVEKAAQPRVLTFVRHESVYKRRHAAGADENGSPLAFEHIDVSSSTFPEEGHHVRIVRAAFGPLPGCGQRRLVLAEPIHGCGDIQDSGEASEAVKGSFVVVARGHCSFTAKARLAQDRGAEGIVVVNGPSQPLVRMPFEEGTDVSDIRVVAVMAEHSLMESMIHAKSATNTNHLLGKIVVSGDCLRGDGRLRKGTEESFVDLEPREEDAEDVERVAFIREGDTTLFIIPKHKVEHGMDGGVVLLQSPNSGPMELWNGRGVEFVAAQIGPKVAEQSGSLILAKNTSPCGPYESVQSLRGLKFLVLPNEPACASRVVEQMQNAGNAGADVIVFPTSTDFLAPLIIPESMPSKIDIPILQITAHAGMHLVEFLQSVGNVAKANIVPDTFVKNQWSALRPMADQTVWPHTEKQRKRLYYRLLKVHHSELVSGSIDREFAVEKAYKAADDFWTLTQTHGGEL